MSGFTYLQNYAYQVMTIGFNVFITGDAGTGKSYVVKKFIEYQRKCGKNVMILAPTGIAAGSLGGVTIHSQFNVPLGPLLANDASKASTRELEKTDILIIEEISMCRIDLFEYLSRLILRANGERIKYNKRPIQFIVLGDFFQLPPVITDYDRIILERQYGQDVGLGFAFQSVYWKLHNFKNIILLDIVRQDNIEFITYLNRVRLGDKTCLDEIYSKSAKGKIPGAINMCGTNKEVCEINYYALEELPGDSVIYRSEYIPMADINIKLLNGYTLAENILELKVGARVMMLVNDKNGDYYNGSIGTVEELGRDTIKVALDKGGTVYVERYEWEVYRYTLSDDGNNHEVLVSTKVGSIVQFPIKLAYAITIHKSQGQTFDAVNLNPYAWDCGQLYVALSRVRKLENMCINYRIDPRYLVVSLKVIEFYNDTVKTANQSITQSDIDKFNKSIEPRKSDKISDDTMNDMEKITSMLKMI